jgi:hypothetical protein
MSESVIWTSEAEAKLKEIPFFVRPAARKKIEKFAQDADIGEITVEIYERAKKQFGSSFGNQLLMMVWGILRPALKGNIHLPDRIKLIISNCILYTFWVRFSCYAFCGVGLN